MHGETAEGVPRHGGRTEAATMGLQTEHARDPRRRARRNRWFHCLGVLAAIAMGGIVLSDGMLAVSSELEGSIVNDVQYFQRIVPIVNYPHTFRAAQTYTKAVVVGTHS